jgi:hypothetical protein
MQLKWVLLYAALFTTVTRGSCNQPYEYKGQRYTDCRFNNNPISRSQGQSPFGCLLPNGKQAFCIQTPGLLISSYFSKKTLRQLFNSIKIKSKKQQSYSN